MTHLTTYEVSRLPTKRWGLEYEFSVRPHYDDDADWTDKGSQCRIPDPVHAFSQWNRTELAKLVEPWMRSIVEIGVSRDGYEYSSTKVLLDNKHEDCRYLGIDIEDRDFILDKASHVRFKRNSSWDVNGNWLDILAQGPSIDLLFIDGDHSVNSVLKEWEYARLLSKNGIVVLHDTNFHPGPWCLMEAVDKTMFIPTRLCAEDTDWGLGVLRRI